MSAAAARTITVRLITSHLLSLASIMPIKKKGVKDEEVPAPTLRVRVASIHSIAESKYSRKPVFIIHPYTLRYRGVGKGSCSASLLEEFFSETHGAYEEPGLL
jgi:hypothetical protein